MATTTHNPTHMQNMETYQTVDRCVKQGNLVVLREFLKDLNAKPYINNPVEIARLFQTALERYNYVAVLLLLKKFKPCLKTLHSKLMFQCYITGALIYLMQASNTKEKSAAVNCLLQTFQKFKILKNLPDNIYITFYQTAKKNNLSAVLLWLILNKKA